MTQPQTDPDQDGRLNDLKRFYAILGKLSEKLNGPQTLSVTSAQVDWPKRGVYFFQEPGEDRKQTGTGSRVVRVGTHALKDGSRTSLWTRLSQHRGQVRAGGGNHRGSIFRLIVGTALIESRFLSCPTWGKGNSTSGKIREGEQTLEKLVSEVLRSMPFLWLGIEDEPSPNSLRGYIERNSIALLSNYGKFAIDPPSVGWLGNLCNRERVRNSGLWNQNHVDENYEPAFLEALENLVKSIKARK